MDNFIRNCNITRYKAHLETETSPVKRKLLLTLLAEEEAKQACHDKSKQEPVGSCGTPTAA
jgi:hypothetical protein